MKNVIYILTVLVLVWTVATSCDARLNMPPRGPCNVEMDAEIKTEICGETE